MYFLYVLCVNWIAIAVEMQVRSPLVAWFFRTVRARTYFSCTYNIWYIFILWLKSSIHINYIFLYTSTTNHIHFQQNLVYQNFILMTRISSMPMEKIYKPHSVKFLKSRQNNPSQIGTNIMILRLEPLISINLKI